MHAHPHAPAPSPIHLHTRIPHARTHTPTVETLYQSLLPNLPQYMIALLKILLAAAPTSKAKTDSINILADVLPEEMPTTVLQSMKLGEEGMLFFFVGGGPLWSGTNENQDVSTGPLACPFACSLAPLIHSLAPDCLLGSRSPLCSLVCSLAHSLPRL